MYIVLMYLRVGQSLGNNHGRANIVDISLVTLKEEFIREKKKRKDEV